MWSKIGEHRCSGREVRGEGCRGWCWGHRCGEKTRLLPPGENLYLLYFCWSLGLCRPKGWKGPFGPSHRLQDVRHGPHIAMAGPRCAGGTDSRPGPRPMAGLIMLGCTSLLSGLEPFLAQLLCPTWDTLPPFFFGL